MMTFLDCNLQWQLFYGLSCNVVLFYFFCRGMGEKCPVRDYEAMKQSGIIDIQLNLVNAHFSPSFYVLRGILQHVQLPQRADLLWLRLSWLMNNEYSPHYLVIALVLVQSWGGKRRGRTYLIIVIFQNWLRTNLSSVSMNKRWCISDSGLQCAK